MAGLSRRRFLGRGTVTVAAATVMAAAPAGVVPAVISAEEAPLTEEEIASTGGAVEGALVAHVKDLATGQISIFAGTREVVVRDQAVVARLVRALK